jgi:hypothetical protein
LLFPYSYIKKGNYITTIQIKEITRKELLAFLDYYCNPETSKCRGSRE